MVDLKNMFRAIGHRNYRLFFFGQAISLCGTWMQTIAQQWLVFRLTDSAIALGAIGFCSQVPILLLVGLGGIVADRMDRHTIVVRTQIASMILATILAILTLTNTIHVWHVYVLSILLGIVNAFDMPARQSLITDLAGKKDMSNAIILNSGEVNAARLVGPAIGGILISIVGEGWCFAINAASYLAVIAGLLSMTVTHTPTKPDPTSVRQRLNEGFQFVNSHLPMRLLLYMVGLMSLLCCPHIVLMPIFATDILHGQSGTLGMLMAFSGAGAVIGALGLATKKTVRNLEYFIASAGLIAGIGFLVYGQSHWLWLTTLIMMPIGAATMMQLALLLGSMKKLTVVTTDIQIAAWLENNTDVTVVMAGGLLRRNHHCTVGQEAIDMLMRLNVDKTFFATNGITTKGGLSTPNMEIAQVKSAMLRRARQSIVLCDSSKFGRDSFVTFAQLSDVETLITDTGADAQYVSEMRLLGLDVRLA